MVHMSLKQFKVPSLSRSKKSGTEPVAVTNTTSTNAVSSDPAEVVVGRDIHTFCSIDAALAEGNEVVLLPSIVESASDAPKAAAAAATAIHKYLVKSHNVRPYEQYNAVMLMRILAENPGAPFTAHFDSKFISTVRSLLKNNPYINVQQLMRSTLDTWEADLTKVDEPGMSSLIKMWKEFKTKAKDKDKESHPSTPTHTPATAAPTGLVTIAPDSTHNPRETQLLNSNERQFNYSRPPTRNELPSTPELASRVEEARNSSKILIQLMQSTPPDEFAANDLIKEFSERCQSAQQSMQRYINCDNPAPDDATMQTLIECVEQLSLALSKYQRARLQARKMAHSNSNSNNTTPQPRTQPQNIQDTMQETRQANRDSTGYFHLPKRQSISTTRGQFQPIQESSQPIPQTQAPAVPLPLRPNSQRSASRSSLRKSLPRASSRDGSGRPTSLGTPAAEDERPSGPPPPVDAYGISNLTSSPEKLQSPFTDEAEVREPNPKTRGQKSGFDDSDEELYSVSPPRLTAPPPPRAL